MMMKKSIYGIAAALTIGAGLIGSAAISSQAFAEENNQESITLGVQPAKDAKEMSIKDVAAATMPSMAAITNTSVEDVQSYYDGFGFGFGFNDFFGSYPQQSYESVSMGTGVIIGMTDDDVLIATNEHVIDGADSLSAAFIDESAAEATVIGKDKSNDLAVIRVAKSDLSKDTLDAIKVITLGTSSDLPVGEEVVAIGNALGYGQSVSAGIISALNRSLTSANQSTGKTETTDGMIQTDASINPGNSGGALLNRKGELIGINSAKYADTTVEGMGYAIPIDTALPILQKIADRLNGTQEASVSLGITGTDVTTEYANYYSIPRGVYISSIDSDGCAARAGLIEGDIITAIDGTKVSDMDDLTKELEDYSIGDTAELSITRVTSSGRYSTRLRSGTVTVTFEDSLFDSIDDSGSSAA